MKKYFLSLLAVVFAVAGSAFTVAEKAGSDDDPMLHWFNPNAAYIGQRTQAAQEELCGVGTSLCAKGYEQITEEEDPVVESFVTDVLKP